MKNALLTSSLLLLFVSALSQPKWKLKLDNDGIQVYNLKNDTAKINELKVVAELNCSPTELAKIILDVNKHKDWVYGTKVAYPLSKISPSEVYFYKEIRSPAPLSNRDLIAHSKVEEQNEKRIVIKVSAKPTYLPEKKGLVRVSFFQEIWMISLAENKKSKVEYYLKIDPGGIVPPMLVNLFATKGPYESFVNLKHLIELTFKKPK